MSHLTRVHGNCEKSLAYNGAPSTLVCDILACGQRCDCLQALLEHLKFHLRKGNRVHCPFVKCTSMFSVLSTFTSHLSRRHKNWSSASIADQFKCNEVSLSDSAEIADLHCNLSPGNADDRDDDSNHSDSEMVMDLEAPLRQKVALFLLDLEAKHHVPSSTLQRVVEEMHNLHSLNAGAIVSNMEVKLATLGLDRDAIASVLQSLRSDPLSIVLGTKGPLRSEHVRRNFYKSEYGYVAPITVALVDDNGEKQFHYVPIKETLRVLFRDQSVASYVQTDANQKIGKLVDIADGLVCKGNMFFRDNPQALKILLFQDAFEVVNPLGSARNKHKILGVYYTLGNFVPSVRSKIDILQLVLLVRDKDLRRFGPKAVFKPLLDDLKSLESDGIDLGTGFGVTKGTVAFVLGDNLGSHFMGGFVESFSTSSFFCRYCLATKLEVDGGKYRPSDFDIRTRDRYDAAVHVTESQSVPLHEGVKGNSVLHSLNHFHVCSPGLPPCLGHDFFEGIVPYDLEYCLSYFVRVRKWFSYEHLNKQIMHFKYPRAVSKDKPVPVNAQTGKVMGHAVQLWTLLRYLPFLIGVKILNTDDGVWRMIVLLRRVVELVCCPVVTNDIVSEMNDAIDDYITLRLQCFPDHKLRPKHHYIAHYPDLTLQCGPLIRLWTLRFESKHSYFKKVIRSAQNFKNVTYTMSNKHQLLQAMYTTGSLFPQAVRCDVSVQFDVSLYSPDVQRAVASVQGLADVAQTRVCDHVDIYGTTYAKSFLVFLGRSGKGQLRCGRIQLVLLQDEVHLCYLLCEVYLTIYAQDVGLLKLMDREGSHLSCVCVNDLLDYCPVDDHIVGTDRYVALKHAV